MSITIGGARVAPDVRARGVRVGGVRVGGRLALGAAVVAAGALGFMGGGDGGAGSDLLVLLRFMAGVKAAMALGAVALVAWRMGAPVGVGTAAAYVAASALMAAGPGLIWDMQHVALGAMAVHGGLSALLVVGWMDRAGWSGVLGEAVARRRLARRV
jgi:hypothetical protein